jgi:HEAT repeat protein
MRCWFLPLLLTAVAYGQVEGKFTLAKSELKAGEPVWLGFEMKNSGKETLYFLAGDPYSFCGGYRLEVTHGDPVQHPSCTNAVGGSCPSGTQIMREGDRVSDRLLLNYDHELTQPGQYHVKATRYVRTATTDDPAAMVHGHETTIEQEFDLDVKPRDDAALQAELAPYVEQLKSSNEAEVREAARVLSSSAPVFLESTMLAMLNQPATRIFAIAGLQKINTAAAREALARLARSSLESYSYEGARAAGALSEMGDRAYFPLLKEIADSKAPNQASEAIRDAATLGGDEAIPWLAAKLQDSDPFARGNVPWALAATGSRRAVPILIDLLLSKDDHAPEAAESALVQLTHHSLSPGTYTSGTPALAHQKYAQWWMSHPDAEVFAPKMCGEIQPLN